MNTAELENGKIITRVEIIRKSAMKSLLDCVVPANDETVRRINTPVIIVASTCRTVLVSSTNLGSLDGVLN